MKFAGAVRAFFDSNACILCMAVALAFDASYQDAYVFPDVNEVVIDTDASCKHRVSFIWVDAGYFECGGGLAW